MKAKKEEIKFKGLMNIQYKIYSYFHVWLLIEETLSWKNIHTLFSLKKITKDDKSKANCKKVPSKPFELWKKLKDDCLLI